MKAEHDHTVFPLAGSVSADTSPIFGIFDGMGGEEHGEIASYIAAESASRLSVGEDAPSDLHEYCMDANEEICRYADTHGIFSMGTTAAMLVFAKKDIVLCNIGDSKIFYFSDGKLEQISQDHVGIAVCGKKPPLSQNLGIPPTEMVIEPYISRGKYNSGDIFLISSDGLTDMVSLEQIRETLKEAPFEKSAGKLLEKALQNGGKDNISIIVCKIDREPCRIAKIFRKRK